MFFRHSKSFSNSNIFRSDLREALKEFFGAEEEPKKPAFRFEEIVLDLYGQIGACQRFITSEDYNEYNRPLGLMSGNFKSLDWRVKSEKDPLPGNTLVYVPYSESRQKVINDARGAMITEFCS